MRFLLDRGGLKPRHRVLVRHGRRETQTQRRSHVETEAETEGGGYQPRDGRPGATGSWKRQGGLLPWRLWTELSLGTP